MNRDHIRQLPVLDACGRIVDLRLHDSFLSPSKYDNVVVVMAGGKGTRLRPYTDSCPKPMLLVGDKPILEILLERCIASGFRKFYFSVNYLKDQIIDYFDNGSRWGVSIEYLVEDKPLGTAGSLSLLPTSLQHPFLVLNGDVLTRLDLGHLFRFHAEHKAKATLCVREHEITVPFGVVFTDGADLTAFQEKPTFSYQVNAGVYVIDPQLLDFLPHDKFTDMPELLESVHLSGHKVCVCPIHEYWLDVGRPETFAQAHRDWPFPDLL